MTILSGYNTEYSYFCDPDQQLLFINDIFITIKIYNEKFYLKVANIEEEKKFISDKAAEKSALNLLGVTYLNHLITLISQLMEKMNLIQTDKGKVLI